MSALEDAVALAVADQGLAVVATLRADATIQSSLVNVARFDHPATGQPGLAFVTYGKVKLANLRRRPQLAVTFREGWRFGTVEGTAELAGPDDPQPWLADAEHLRLLLRDVFSAAGGTHDDWETYDAEMLRQRRTVVLITPTRIYGNATS